MAQQFRALAVLTEDLGSIPSTYTVPYNPPYLQLQVSLTSPQTLCVHQVCSVHGAQTYTWETPLH